MGKLGLGKRINEIRKSRKLTAEKLSELCNINATYLRQIEGGIKTPSLPVFISICKELCISPDYLLQDELTRNTLTGLSELETLWKNISPSDQELVLTIIRAVVSQHQS